MIQLLDIKSSKEKYLTELEGLRSEIAKEKAVMTTLKSCNAPVPALDLTSPTSVSEVEMEPALPSLAPALRRDVRHRPDYYRQMFEPHHPPMMHYTGHHTRQVNQPVNFSRAMEQERWM